MSLSLSSCATAPPPVVIDSYCEEYVQVIRDKGDADIKAKLEVKKRILVNERNFKGCSP